MVENDDAATGLYLTEMGWGSQNDPNVVAFEQGIQGQARELRKAYRFLIAERHTLNLKGTYWYSWKDNPEYTACSFCDSVGLFRAGPKFRPKPAWRAFVAVTAPRGRARTHSVDAPTEPAWVVLPTYDEAENIEDFIVAVLPVLPASARILIVDDNSPDGTGEIADRLAAADPRIGVLHRPHKEGLGPAYIAGFRHALEHGAQLLLEMDSDFSHDPAYLPAMLAAMEEADLAIGSRYVAGAG